MLGSPKASPPSQIGIVGPGFGGGLPYYFEPSSQPRMITNRPPEIITQNHSHSSTAIPNLVSSSSSSADGSVDLITHGTHAIGTSELDKPLFGFYGDTSSDPPITISDPNRFISRQSSSTIANSHSSDRRMRRDERSHTNTPSAESLITPALLQPSSDGSNHEHDDSTGVLGLGFAVSGSIPKSHHHSPPLSTVIRPGSPSGVVSASSSRLVPPPSVTGLNIPSSLLPPPPSPGLVSGVEPPIGLVNNVNQQPLFQPSENGDSVWTLAPVPQPGGQIPDQQANQPPQPAIGLPIFMSYPNNNPFETSEGNNNNNGLTFTPTASTIGQAKVETIPVTSLPPFATALRVDANGIATPANDPPLNQPPFVMHGFQHPGQPTVLQFEHHPPPPGLPLLPAPTTVSSVNSGGVKRTLSDSIETDSKFTVIGRLTNPVPDTDPAVLDQLKSEFCSGDSGQEFNFLWWYPMEPDISDDLEQPEFTEFFDSRPGSADLLNDKGRDVGSIDHDFNGSHSSHHVSDNVSVNGSFRHLTF